MLPEFLSGPLALKIFKFGVVGFSSFVMDFTITYIAKEKFKLNQYLANSFGFLFAAIYNFTLNRMWTFQSHDTEVGWQFVKFGLSMSFGLLIANALIYVFNEKLNFNFYLSKLMAVCVVMVWNFTMNNLVIFAH
ncbi:MAG: GtrA family protein [Chitinophagales bacterium]